VSFLTDIVDTRKRSLAADFGVLAPADRERLACCARPPRDFVAALRDPADVAVIAEVKRSSPSLGEIAPDAEASKQACVYQYGGANAISVLTEPSRFGGSFGDLSDVADAVDVPVLCKDFVVDPLQLFLARGNGADAVLLMVSVLGEDIAGYIDLAHTLGLAPLVEVHSMAELDTAWNAGARLVGVNSRDLRDLSVDLERARLVVREARRIDLTVVAESGITTRGDVEAAAEAGADAVLVGTALMKARFPEDVLDQLTGVRKGGRDDG
jgi:indole-3-glycerol phosphate synthase